MFNICNHKQLLNELKCGQCSKVLSVFPVYFNSNLGNTCGRCVDTIREKIADGTVQRAVAYEAIAKFLIFPCSNYEQGCEEKFNSKDIVQHEQQCQCVLTPCPFNLKFGKASMKCDWKGVGKNLAQHLQNNHKDCMQVDLPSFVLNVYVTYVKIFFTVIDNITFLVIIQYLKNNNKFYCTVVCCEKPPVHRCYRYQLELGRKDDYFLNLRKPETKPFCNVQEIINNQEKMISVDVTSVYGMLEDPNELIYCKISILKKSKKEVALIKSATVTVSTTPTPKANKPKPKAPLENVTKQVVSSASFQSWKSDVSNIKLGKQSNNANKPNPKALQENVQKQTTPQNENQASLDVSNIKLGEQSNQVKVKNFCDELECPVCNNYMMPPIFICPTGHSICNCCKIKVELCPLCRCTIQDTRNFTLEKLAATFKYPCKYKDYGCTITLNHEQFGLHQVHCQYAYGRCPLHLLDLCNVNEDLVHIIGHLRGKHSSYIVETNKQYSRDIVGSVTTSNWVTIFDNKIFIICCKHSNSPGPVKFNVLHVGMNKVKSKYKYELEFSDQTGNGLKLIISRLCQAFPSNPSLALKKCLMIPQDLLEPFMINKPAPTVFFKFYIQKL